MRSHSLLALMVTALLSACGDTGSNPESPPSEPQVRSAASLSFPSAFIDKYLKPVLAKSSDVDTDGDGVPDSADAFPTNPAEFLDSDGDGIGNFTQADEDLDGVIDYLDAFPFDPLRSSYPEATEIEPNETASSASTIQQPFPIRLRGTLSGPNDVDYFERPIPPQGSYLSVVTFKAGPSSIVKIDLFSPDGREQSAGDRVWRKPKNSVEASIFHQTLAGIRYLESEPELNYLRIAADAGASFPQEYEILVYADGDMDLVPDDLEDAVGARSDLIHSADTHIPDFVKIHVAIRSGMNADADSDGIPVWLDRDSDGDSFPDMVEGYDDIDEDGLPNYADLDSDGNGISDPIECAAISGRCLDTDKDGLANWRDTDDDADAILDVNDVDRLVPAQLITSTAEGRPALFGAHTIASDERPVSRVARSGNTLVIDGASLQAFGANPLVSISTDMGALAETRGELRNIRGQFVNGELHVPFLWKKSGNARLFVTDGNLATGAISITALAPEAPILTETSTTVVSNQIQITVYGDRIPSDAQLLVDGQPVSVVTRSGNYQVTASLPATQKRAPVQILSAAGNSNEMEYQPSIGKRIRIQYPAGYFLAYSNVRALSDSFHESVPSLIGQADITAAKACTLVVLSGIPAQDASVTVMSGFVDQMDYLPPVNAETTAVSYAFVPLLMGGFLMPEDVCALRAQVASLPSVQALKSLIENRLAVNKELPNFTRLVNVAYLKAAVNATADLVAQAQSSSATSASHAYAAKSMVGYTPIITPTSQHDVAVRADKIPNSKWFDGKLSFENDTRVFFSVRATSLHGGVEIIPHATSWTDSRLIQPQQGLVYLGGPYDTGNRPEPLDIDFADVNLELMKSASGIQSIDAAVNAATRTIVQQVMTPWLSAILGLPGHAAYDTISALMSHYPGLETAVKAAIQDGNYALAQKLILNQLQEDFMSLGPALRYLLTLAMKTPSVAMHVLLRRINAFVSGASLITDLSTTAADSAKTLKDLSTVPGRLEYTVEWPMWIESTRATDNASDAATGRSLLVLEGYGFREYTESGNYANLRLLAVVNGWQSHVVGPTSIASNGTKVTVDANEEFWQFYNHTPGGGTVADLLELTFLRDTDFIGVTKESNTKGFDYRIITTEILCAPMTTPGKVAWLGWEYLWHPYTIREGAEINLAFNGCTVLSVREGYWL